jgi:hypothetical protein
MTERLASRIAARRPPARWCARIAGKAISTTANSQTATSGRALTPQAERTTEQRAGQKNPLALMHPHRHATRSLCASPETQPPPEPPSAPLHSRGPRGVKPDVTVPSGETAVQARQNPTASGHTQSERPTASDARANSNAGLDPHVARRLLFAKLASGGEGRPARASALVSAQRRDMARAAGNTRGGRRAGRGRGRWRCGFSRRPTSPCCVGASRDRAGQRCPSHGRTVAEQLF